MCSRLAVVTKNAPAKGKQSLKVCASNHLIDFAPPSA